MPITIGPKQPMLTAVSDEELEERKLRKKKRKSHLEKILEELNKTSVEDHEENEKEFQEDILKKMNIKLHEFEDDTLLNSFIQAEEILDKLNKRKNKSKAEKILEKIYNKEQIQHRIENTVLKNSYSDLCISKLDNQTLTLKEKNEIIEFANIAKDILKDSNESAKILATNQYITDKEEWDKFPSIRAYLEFAKDGESNKKYKGISKKYYRIVMKLLGSGTAGTNAYVVKETYY